MTDRKREAQAPEALQTQRACKRVICFAVGLTACSLFFFLGEEIWHPGRSVGSALPSRLSVTKRSEVSLSSGIGEEYKAAHGTCTVAEGGRLSTLNIRNIYGSMDNALPVAVSYFQSPKHLPEECQEGFTFELPLSQMTAIAKADPRSIGEKVAKGVGLAAMMAFPVR